MKKTLLVSILLISLMLIGSQIAYGGGNPLPPPPEGSKLNYVGPDITGTLIFEDTSTSLVTQVTVTLNGSCKNLSFMNSTTYQIDFLDCVSPEWLLGTCITAPPCACTGWPQTLPDSLVPYDCYPDNKIVWYYPVVYKVNHFTENGNTKTADIVGRFPVIVHQK